MLLQQLLNGIGIGCTYALIALGYNLIFGVLKVVNLAYGEVFMFSAYAVLIFTPLLSGQPLLVVLAVLVVSISMGLLIHLVAVRPLGTVTDVTSPRHLSALISTLGCSLIMQHVAIEIFGGYPRRVPLLLPAYQLNVLGGVIDSSMLLNLTVSFLVMSALYHFLSKTFAGFRIRAISENAELALSSGIRTPIDVTLCVVVSSALAGVAALSITQTIGTVSPYIGLSYGFKGLVILIVGGAGNIPGSALIALFLGITEVLTVAYISSSYRDAVAFGLLVVLLIVKGFLRGSTFRI